MSDISPEAFRSGSDSAKGADIGEESVRDAGRAGESARNIIGTVATDTSSVIKNSTEAKWFIGGIAGIASVLLLPKLLRHPLETGVSLVKGVFKGILAAGAAAVIGLTAVNLLGGQGYIESFVNSFKQIANYAKGLLGYDTDPPQLKVQPSSDATVKLDQRLEGLEDRIETLEDTKPSVAATPTAEVESAPDTVHPYDANPPGPSDVEYDPFAAAELDSANITLSSDFSNASNNIGLGGYVPEGVSLEETPAISTVSTVIGGGTVSITPDFSMAADVDISSPSDVIDLDENNVGPAVETPVENYSPAFVPN